MEALSNCPKCGAQIARRDAEFVARGMHDFKCPREAK